MIALQKSKRLVDKVVSPTHGVSSGVAMGIGLAFGPPSPSRPPLSENESEGTMGGLSKGSSTCDDSGEVESLPEEDEDARVSSPPPYSPQQQQQQQQPKTTALPDPSAIAEAERKLLARTVCPKSGIASAVSALNSHHQSRGTMPSGGIRSCFSYVQTANLSGPGLWVSTFTCPFTGTGYRSSLPLSILLGADFMAEGEGDCRAAGTDLLGGEKHEMLDGQVFFRTKKGAQRGAALAALEGLIAEEALDGGNSDSPTVPRIMHPSISGATDVELNGTAGGLGGAGSHEPAGSAADGGHAIAASKRKCAKHPHWVERLYELGISSSALTVQFAEHVPPCPRPLLSRDHPTLLRCILSITVPFPLEVAGEPRPSKGGALDSAVDVLSEEMKAQLSKETLQSHLRARECLPEGWEWEEKDRLVTCKPKWGDYVFPLPSWTNGPVQERLHLYEIILQGLDQTCVTRLGIVFSEDIPFSDDARCGRNSAPTNAPVLETRFALPGQSIGSDETAKVQLVSRGTVSLLRKEDGQKDCPLCMIREFNRTIHKWKVYGFDHRKRCKERRMRKGHLLTECPEEAMASTCQMDRTYMFVPLSYSSTTEEECFVDWDLLQRVCTSEPTPYMTSALKYFTVPCLGEQRYDVLGWIFVLLGVASTAPALRGNPKKESLTLDLRTLDALEITVGALMILASAFTFLLGWLVPAKKNFSEEALSNHFLIQQHCLLQKKAASAVYALQPEHCLEENDKSKNAYSTFSSDHGETTFSRYYFDRHGIKIKCCSEQLIPVVSVTQHALHDFIAQKDGVAQRTAFLMPELANVLPMPRDILYVCRHVASIMLPVEREIEIIGLTKRMEEIGKTAESRLSRSSTSSPNMYGAANSEQHCPRRVGHLKSRTFASLLNEATTMAPCKTYERLEFVGDAVLTYYLAINAMARNSALEWDFDDFGNMISDAGKNEELTHAALHIGLSHVMWVGNRKWQSACRYDSHQSSSSAEPSAPNHHSAQISDSSLSDVVESMLAAAFIEGRKASVDEHDGSMVIGLMEELELPVPKSQDGNNADAGLPWFRALGPCLRHGYPFALDHSWKKMLINIWTAAQNHRGIVEQLKSGRQKLLIILAQSLPTHLQAALESEQSTILMLSALFDDCLDSEGDEEASDVPEAAPQGLKELALLRDTLFHVGNAALFLALSTDLYQRCPSATPGDMHLMLACAINDDALCYIFVKNDLHKCLYDQDSLSVREFEAEAKYADVLGLESWRKRDGWVLSGGVDEFRRRINEGLFSDCSSSSLTPQYVGLAGGRLHGKKTKLSADLTDDLQFSAKALAGALTLSLGVDGMWHCLGPLFEELMLLSADELRTEYGQISSMCSTYGPGKRSQVQD